MKVCTLRDVARIVPEITFSIMMGCATASKEAKPIALSPSEGKVVVLTSFNKEPGVFFNGTWSLIGLAVESGNNGRVNAVKKVFDGVDVEGVRHDVVVGFNERGIAVDQDSIPQLTSADTGEIISTLKKNYSTYDNYDHIFFILLESWGVIRTGFGIVPLKGMKVMAQCSAIYIETKTDAILWRYRMDPEESLTIVGDDWDVPPEYEKLRQAVNRSLKHAANRIRIKFCGVNF